jgi:hypothetical protein
MQFHVTPTALSNFWGLLKASTEWLWQSIFISMVSHIAFVNIGMQLKNTINVTKCVTTILYWLSKDLKSLTDQWVWHEIASKPALWDCRFKWIHLFDFCFFSIYSQTCIKRSPLGQRKRGFIRQVTSWKRFNTYEMFYDRTINRWPLNTGDCVIKVTTSTGLTIIQSNIYIYDLSTREIFINVL